MSATMIIDMDDFNAQVAQVARLIDRNGGSYVRTTARRLIKKAAWRCPRATGKYAAAGRARAGFWPAALALGISNIYTNHPNKDEGAGVDRSRDSNPSFTIENRVPYIGLIPGGTGWFEDAKQAVRAQMAKDLERLATDTWARQDLIEDLTGD